MNHRQYRKTFRMIDDALWNTACAEGKSLDYRKRRVAQDCEWMKDVLSAYIDESAKRMLALLSSKRFSRFPTPQRRIPIWIRISARLELWKAMRPSISRILRDCAPVEGADDPPA